MSWWDFDFDLMHSQHEEMSLKMFDHLLANNPALRPAYSAFGLQTQDVELIKDLIVGRNAAARPANKRFLFDVSEGKSLVTRQECPSIISQRVFSLFVCALRSWPTKGTAWMWTSGIICTRGSFELLRTVIGHLLDMPSTLTALTFSVALPPGLETAVRWARRTASIVSASSSFPASCGRKCRKEASRSR